MKIKIGTRGSTLALAQTALVLNALRECHPSREFSHLVVQTQGDRKQGTEEASRGDKEDWIKELELALLSGEIDAALHSGKDIPSVCSAETVLIPVLKRATPNDAFVGKLLPSGERRLFSELQAGDVVGTASLRRKALLLENRADLRVQEFRGNVPTRIRKLDEGSELSGILLAAAGFERLDLSDLKYEILDSETFLPSVNQGMLVVQVLIKNPELQGVFGPLCDPEAFAVWQTEREIARVLDGDCNSAMGIFAEVKEGTLQAQAKVLLPDGSKALFAKSHGELGDATDLGARIGQELLDKGAEALLKMSSSAH